MTGWLSSTVTEKAPRTSPGTKVVGSLTRTQSGVTWLSEPTGTRIVVRVGFR